MSEKLQKVLAQQGIGSRRQLEQWIKEGRVKVNNQVAHLGQRVLPADALSVDGKTLKRTSKARAHPRVLLYYKPEGEVCTHNDPEGRPTIYKNLPKLEQSKWISVGRLDLNTSGLLLLTNDGELSNRLMHPRYELEREYLVRVRGVVRREDLKMLTHGVQLEDGFSRFTRVVAMEAAGRSNHWYRVALKTGRNREVRRLWESLGYEVSRLKRIRYGDIQLPPALKPRKWVALLPHQQKALYQKMDLSL